MSQNDIPKVSAPVVVATITAVGLFLLALLYLGLSRYYNAQELHMLIDGATAKGQDYTVIIHSGLTGRYSFSID